MVANNDADGLRRNIKEYTLKLTIFLISTIIHSTFSPDLSIRYLFRNIMYMYGNTVVLSVKDYVR